MDPNGAFIPAYGPPMQNQFTPGARPATYAVPVGMYPYQASGIYSAVEESRRMIPEVTELSCIQRKRQSSEAEIVFRLLLPESQLSSVLNGSTDFQMPVGCRIRLCERVPSCEERVIVISAKDERKDDSNIAMQGLLNAVSRTLSTERAIRENSRSANQFYMIRLLINRTQAGAVIGKGGILNKDIKEKTGAYSKILNSDEVPLCALHNDRVVQVTGSVEQVMAGMQIIAKQLRDNLSKERPGGPPSCLTLLSGFTVYYAFEAPSYLPGTNYGRPKVTTTIPTGSPASIYQMQPALPPTNPIYSAAGAIAPPQPPPNPHPRQAGYIPFNRPGRAVYSQSPVIYTTNQTHAPFNGGQPPPATPHVYYP